MKPFLLAKLLVSLLVSLLLLRSDALQAVQASGPHALLAAVAVRGNTPRIARIAALPAMPRGPARVL